jgi:hypothetical protein
MRKLQPLRKRRQKITGKEISYIGPKFIKQEKEKSLSVPIHPLSPLKVQGRGSKH